MPTKAEIQQELDDLKREHKDLLSGIDQFFEQIYCDLCNEGQDYVDDFYETLELKKPTIDVTLRISSFVNLEEIDLYDRHTDKEIEFEHIIKLNK